MWLIIICQWQLFNGNVSYSNISNVAQWLANGSCQPVMAKLKAMALSSISKAYLSLPIMKS